MAALKDITGQRFGRLVVIDRAGSDTQGLATWLCKCDCGRSCVVRGAAMRKGNTKSCGCLHVEGARIRRTSHGKSNTRLNGIWSVMKQRCYNSSNKNYNRYGGRGITVCDEWRNDFQSFYDWAMANGYDENAPTGQCTLDRIDNDKGYSPDNCRWVDMKVQRHNRSDARVKNNERN